MTNFSENVLGIYYRRRNEPIKIVGGDYKKFQDNVDVIGKFLLDEKKRELNEEDIMEYMRQRMFLDF